MPTTRRTLRNLVPATAALLLVVAAAAPAGAIMARNYGTVFAAHETDVRACYAASHPHAPASTLHAVYHVAPQGTLDQWSVGQPADRALATVAACIEQKARTWAFQPSSTGGSREITFEFHPGAAVAMH